MDIIDVEMVKEEIDCFVKGLEWCIGWMEMKVIDDLVLLIRDKGYKFFVLMKDVYEWYWCDYELRLRKYDIVDKDVLRIYSEE